MRKMVKDKICFGLRWPPDGGTTQQLTKNTLERQRRERRRCTRYESRGEHGGSKNPSIEGDHGAYDKIK